MRLIPLVLCLVAPLLQAADEAVLPRPERKTAAIFNVLPDGSELHRVMLPQYNEDRRLSSVLKADLVRLVNEDTISGETVTIEAYDRDQQPAGRVELREAIFDEAKGRVVSRSPVVLKSRPLHARAAGLLFDIGTREGLLVGPAETRIRQQPQTAMITRPATLLAAVGIAAASQTLSANPLAASEPAAESAPSEPAAESAATEPAAATKEAAAATRADLRAALAASEAANAAARKFIDSAEELAAGDAGGGDPPHLPPTAPLDFEPGENDTVISSDGGVHFNTAENVIVYLKNVRVTDPRFTLRGANELKIFLAPKAAAEPAAEDNKAADPLGGFGGRFGDVERIYATGAVVIEQIPEDAKSPPVRASGAIFDYNLATERILISGGYPWVVRGGFAQRAKEPNLTLRIHARTGEFETIGKWDTILPLEEMKKADRPRR